LLEGIQALKGKFLSPEDVKYITVRQQGRFVSTISFPCLGREDSYVGDPQATDKEAEHSAANAAFFAMEAELAMAVKLMKDRKQRRLARKAKGIHAALQFLMGSDGGGNDGILDVPYSYSHEDVQKDHRHGYIATLYVPSLQEDGFRGTWRPTMQEAEESACDNFYSVWEAEFVLRESQVT
jgi:hypothetical protein